MSDALRVSVVDGSLIISISVETLAFAAQALFNEQAFEASEGRRNTADFFIADPVAFAESVALWLNHEREDGSNRVTEMLDDAFEYVANHGSDGLEEGRPPPLDGSPDAADAFAYAALRLKP